MNTGKVAALVEAVNTLLNCHTGAPWQTEDIRNKAFRNLVGAREALTPEEVRRADGAGALAEAATLIERGSPEPVGLEWLSVMVRRSEWSEFLAAIAAMRGEV